MKIGKLNDDVLEVLKILKVERKVDADYLKQNVSNPDKIAYAIRKLKRIGVISVIPKLLDMRSVHYRLEEHVLKGLIQEGLIDV